MTHFRHPSIPVLVIVLALVAIAPVNASWPTFRGPTGTGAAGDGLPPGDGPLTLEVAWKQPLGSGYSGISIAGETVVTAFTAGDRDVIAAFDTATGDERWRHDLAPRYAGHDGSHDGPISTPAIAGERVIALGPLGHLAALDLVTGEALWTTHLVEDHGCEAPYYGFASSPAVIDNVIVLQIGGEAGSVAGFDVETGDLRWRSVEDGSMAQSPIAADLGGQRQVLVLGSKRLAGVRPADGAILWQLEHGGEGGPMGSATSSPMPLGDDRVFLKHEDPSSVVVALRTGDSAVTPAVERSSRGMARSYSPPALSGDAVYGFTARFLSAVDPSTGDLLWRSRDPGDGFVATVGDQLAVLTKKGDLHLGPASRSGWTESSRIELFDDLAWTPPSYSNGAFYVRSLSEIARVDLVRSASTLRAESGLPAALAAIAAAENPAAAIDELLDAKELPLVDGEEVVFLWRGAAEDVAVAGEMIGMRREEPMRRLGATDLWWWSTRLDRHARISYLFYVDYEPILDPSHDRRVTSTVLGPDMNWNRGEAAEMSWFAMPEWPGESESATARSSVAGGRLETLEITVEMPAAEEGGEPPEPVLVPVHVWLPSGYDNDDERYPVVFVHNAFARQEGGWPQALDRVVGSTVRPLIAVFAEIPQRRNMQNVFIERVVPAIDEHYRTTSDPDSRANIGQGWNAFGVTLLNFSHPDRFGVLGIQSFYGLDEQMAMVRATVADTTDETVPMRIYLEWGRWDLISPHEAMDMRTSSRQAWELFEEQGFRPMGGEVWDSTDWASWRNRTGAMLEALFPAVGAGGSLKTWQTGE